MGMDEILLEVEEKMEHDVEYLRKEFRGIRTGRASPGLVEHIKVDYYGSPTDLRQLASITTPDASLIVIKPFDPGSIKEIDKAIAASNIGINPQSDGKVIRMVVPALSGERRHQITAQLKKLAEAARVAVRNARRDGNKDADHQQKSSEMTEDDTRICKEDIQKLTDKYEAAIEELLSAKTQEIEEA
ncbi:MAG: ribosome recycling factor [Planctomycetota bacterium]|nr:ribosome recycling factor [Planctomycetota bacterium]